MVEKVTISTHTKNDRNKEKKVPAALEELCPIIFHVLAVNIATSFEHLPHENLMTATSYIWKVGSLGVFLYISPSLLPTAVVVDVHVFL